MEGLRNVTKNIRIARVPNETVIGNLLNKMKRLSPSTKFLGHIPCPGVCLYIYIAICIS
jgi:hypothetical protein